MTIEANLTELLADLDLFDNWLDKYQYIIDLGKSLPIFAPEAMLDENLVEGCQSRVWLLTHLNLAESSLNFQATSDAAIVKGLIAIVMKLYNTANLDEFLQRDINSDLDKLGLTKHLSMTRKNGLFAILEKLKDLVKAEN